MSMYIKPYDDAKIFLPSVVPTVLYIISIRQLNVPLFYVEAKKYDTTVIFGTSCY